MSQLLQQIRAAQIRAVEDAVIANLQSMGLARVERDAPTALAAYITDQAQTREMNNLRTERDTLLNALRQIATTEACSNSDPDVMGEALDNAVAVVVTKPMSTYRCEFCGALHLGEPNRPKRPIKTIRNNHRMRFT